MTTAQILSDPTRQEAAANVTATYRDLAAALAATKLGVAARPAAPVLAGVKVAASTTDVTLTAFDYDVAVRVTVPSEGVGGDWLLQHAEVTRMLAAASKGEPKKTVDAMAVTLAHDAASGDPTMTAAGFTVPLSNDLDGEELPAFPPRGTRVAQVSRDQFESAVTRTMAACGTDDMLPVLTHVHMSTGAGALTLHATDRFRVTEAAVATFGPSTESEALVPGRILVAALKHLNGDVVTIHVQNKTPKHHGRVAFVSGNVEVSVTTHDGEFPKVQSLFPTVTYVSATIPVGNLRKAARKAAALNEARNGKNEAMALRVSATGVTVAPHVPGANAGAAAPEVEAQVRGLNAPEVFETGFNPRFLLDLLAGFDETVTFHFTTEPKPMAATARYDGLSDAMAFKHLLMPRRLVD